MRLLCVLLLLAVAGAINAYQTLGAGYFLSSNVTVGANGGVVAGLDTNPNVTLLVIPSSELNAYINAGGVQELYNRSVGSGIYLIPLAPGTYSVVFQSEGPTELAVGAAPYTNGDYKLVNLNGNYGYQFGTGNYSMVNVTVLTSSDFATNPISVNSSDEYLNITSDAVIEYLNLSVGRGQHTIYFSSGRQEELFVSTNSSMQLVDPLSEIEPGENYPIGVASYGLYNVSGTLVPYQVSTDEILGTANITSLSATTEGNVQNVSEYGASLQLNVELDTNYAGGSRVYWLQDVADFNTSDNTVYFVDNIWNNTLPVAGLSNVTFEGSGNVSSCGECNSTPFYVYSYPYLSINYSFPLSVKLLIFENQTQQGTMLNFAYQLLRNGNQSIQPLIYYDKVLLPGTYNSTILVTPYYTTPGGGEYLGNNYDAELVFGGEASGSTSVFSRMGATMWIYYLENGMVTPFPSAYTFGLSTAESARGVKVTPGGYGGIASTGRPDYAEDIIVGNVPTQITQYITNTSAYTAPTTAPPYVYTSPGLGVAGGEIEGLVPYLIILVVVLLVLIFVSAVLRRVLRSGS